MCISIHVQLYRSICICAVYVHTYRSARPVPNICPQAHRHSTRQPAQFHPLHPWRIPEQCSAPCQFPKLYKFHHRRVHSSLICFIWPTQIHSQISQALLQVSTQAVGIQLTLGQEAFSAVWSFFLQFRGVSKLNLSCIQLGRGANHSGTRKRLTRAKAHMNVHVMSWLHVNTKAGPRWNWPKFRF